MHDGNTPPQLRTEADRQAHICETTERRPWMLEFERDRLNAIAERQPALMEGDESPDMPVAIGKAARNEQAKLRATFFNGLGVAGFAIGAFGPITALQRGGDFTWGLYTTSIMVCSISIFAHFTAANFLRELED